MRTNLLGSSLVAALSLGMFSGIVRRETPRYAPSYRPASRYYGSTTAAAAAAKRLARKRRRNKLAWLSRRINRRR